MFSIHPHFAANWKKLYKENYFIKFSYYIKPFIILWTILHPKRYKNSSMNLLIVHSRSSADHKPYRIPASTILSLLSSTVTAVIINGERIMYLTAEIRRSLYSPSTSLRIENDQTRPGGLSFSVRPHQHSRTRIYPTKRTNERVSRSQSSQAAAKLLANQMAVIIVHVTQPYGQYKRDLTWLWTIDTSCPSFYWPKQCASTRFKQGQLIRRASYSGLASGAVVVGDLM